VLILSREQVYSEMVRGSAIGLYQTTVLAKLRLTASLKPLTCNEVERMGTLTGIPEQLLYKQLWASCEHTLNEFVHLVVPTQDYPFIRREYKAMTRRCSLPAAILLEIEKRAQPELPDCDTPLKLKHFLKSMAMQIKL
jgi:hypothetical protein